MLKQVQELRRWSLSSCPSSFCLCLLAVPPVSPRDKSDFSKGEWLCLLRVGSQGWVVGCCQLGLHPGRNFNTWSNFAVMLARFCEQDLRRAILISIRKFIISILCWSYIQEPWYQMHKALVDCTQISEQTAFRLSGLERSFWRRTLLIWGNVTEK